jgi:hypothetical protein
MANRLHHGTLTYISIPPRDSKIFPALSPALRVLTDSRLLS